MTLIPSRTILIIFIMNSL